eukprot:GHVN01058543.1.p1 GENE.GHVN01058543.1~~GHVN01058543.1.p1  ORF type:complete len:954 (-),score=110.51 GHVN01058543.1:4240-7101(-)
MGEAYFRVVDMEGLTQSTAHPTDWVQAREHLLGAHEDIATSLAGVGYNPAGENSETNDAHLGVSICYPSMKDGSIPSPSTAPSSNLSPSLFGGSSAHSSPARSDSRCNGSAKDNVLNQSGDDPFMDMDDCSLLDYAERSVRSFQPSTELEVPWPNTAAPPLDRIVTDASHEIVDETSLPEVVSVVCSPGSTSPESHRCGTMETESHNFESAGTEDRGSSEPKRVKRCSDAWSEVGLFNAKLSGDVSHDTLKDIDARSYLISDICPTGVSKCGVSQPSAYCSEESFLANSQIETHQPSEDNLHLPACVLNESGVMNEQPIDCGQTTNDTVFVGVSQAANNSRSSSHSTQSQVYQVSPMPQESLNPTGTELVYLNPGPGLAFGSQFPFDHHPHPNLYIAGEPAQVAQLSQMYGTPSVENGGDCARSGLIQPMEHPVDCVSDASQQAEHTQVSRSITSSGIQQPETSATNRLVALVLIDDMGNGCDGKDREQCVFKPKRNEMEVSHSHMSCRHPQVQVCSSHPKHTFQLPHPTEKTAEAMDSYETPIDMCSGRYNPVNGGFGQRPGGCLLPAVSQHGSHCCSGHANYEAAADSHLAPTRAPIQRFYHGFRPTALPTHKPSVGQQFIPQASFDAGSGILLGCPQSASMGERSEATELVAQFTDDRATPNIAVGGDSTPMVNGHTRASDAEGRFDEPHNIWLVMQNGQMEAPSTSFHGDGNQFVSPDSLVGEVSFPGGSRSFRPYEVAPSTPLDTQQCQNVEITRVAMYSRKKQRTLTQEDIAQAITATKTGGNRQRATPYGDATQKVEGDHESRRDVVWYGPSSSVKSEGFQPPSSEGVCVEVSHSGFHDATVPVQDAVSDCWRSNDRIPWMEVPQQPNNQLDVQTLQAFQGEEFPKVSANGNSNRSFMWHRFSAPWSTMAEGGDIGVDHLSRKHSDDYAADPSDKLVSLPVMDGYE